MLQLNLLEKVEHIIPISGKDSLVAALVQVSRNPRNEYKFVFNDTGSELPETYQWLNEVEARTGWQIYRTNASIEAKIRSRNGFLPSHFQRWCTKECKIDPMDDFVGHSPAFLYLGLRADETGRKGFIPSRKSNIFPVYPLKDAGFSLPHVWGVLESKCLLPPSFHWERLEMAVVERLPESKWIPLQPWQRRSIFAGRTRGNCFHCFYQRLYEWLWLKETHPELFYRARSYEKPDYSWNADHPLSEFENEVFCSRIFEGRVRKVIEVLQGRTKDLESDLSAVSCGLLCGK